MYNLPDFSRNDIPEPTASEAYKTTAWKTWISIECQRRTLLGLYIIDAQLARYAGVAPMGKHVNNPLRLASKDSIFQASTADDWAEEMRRHWVIPCTFREFYLDAFLADPLSLALDSLLSTSVVLEGLQAVSAEHGDANGAALGIPPLPDVIRASLKFHQAYLSSSTSPAENVEHLLRWHTLCLDLATDSVLLCRQLCVGHIIDQNLFPTGRKSPDPIELDAWACTADGRRALLHAFSIQDLAESLTLGRTSPAHFPASVFAAATIFYAFLSCGYTTMTTPEDVDWTIAWTSQEKGGTQMTHGHALADSEAWSCDSYRFVKSHDVFNGKTKLRALRFSLLSLQMILQMIAPQWGISYDMLDILSSWMSTHG